MKKTAIVILIALTALSCSQRDTRVTRRIAKDIKSKTQTMDFSTIAPFEWDRLYFFCPYSPQNLIEETIGVPWAEYKKSGIGSDEGHTLMLFLNKGKVVAWCMNQRKYGDFTAVYNANGYSRADAQFIFDYSAPSGRPSIKAK